MRDVLLLGFIAACLLMTVRYPFVGLMLWAWFTLATPQQSAYAAATLPLNMLIAATVFLTFFLHQEFRKIRLDTLTVLILAFSTWLLISQANSLDPEFSAEPTDRFFKCMIFIVLCTQVVNTKLRFHALLWVFILIMGFFGSKGGAYTILKLGQGTYTGVIDSILYDNNHMGIALATTLPMFLYMRTVMKSKLVRMGLMLVFGLSVIAIIGTNSRGALISLVAFGFVVWLRSSHKLPIILALAVLAIPAYQLIPDKWFDRMETIKSADEDKSFMGRVDAWIISSKLAVQHPLTGVGMRNTYQKKISRTVEYYRTPRASHSVWFEVLGGTGFVGLFIYIGIFGTGFLKAVSAHYKYKYADNGRWRSNFGYYAQISLIVFAVGGSSTSMEMWEGYLVILALIAVMDRIDLKPADIHQGYAIRKVRRKVRSMSDLEGEDIEDAVPSSGAPAYGFRKSTEKSPQMASSAQHKTAAVSVHAKIKSLRT